MRIAMIGTGYVGLVTGTCFAESGNTVVCVDVDAAKVAALRNGKIPIYEPGLEELVTANSAAGRLSFTTDLAAAVAQSQVIFLAVGTPQGHDGAADLSALFAAAESLAPHLAADAVVVVKSTVPVGTNREVLRRLRDLTGRDCDVASNPEFLKEGCAIQDFQVPDRVVVGVRRPEVAETLRQLYEPFTTEDRPFLVMSPESSELTKYVANAMLATKISFINEMANVCEAAGGDINDVRQGIGYDQRIGFQFLAPGVGYGGSCFPKDVRALSHTAASLGLDSQILTAVDEANDRQKTVLFSKIKKHFDGELAGKKIAIWGLAFKPNTDDIREAPALHLIEQLTAAGASIVAYDPEAAENVRDRYGDKIEFAATAEAALAGADALAVCTEWPEFQQVSLAEVRQRLQSPVVFDGRNIWSRDEAEAAGVHYHSIGRQTVECKTC